MKTLFYTWLASRPAMAAMMVRIASSHQTTLFLVSLMIQDVFEFSFKVVVDTENRGSEHQKLRYYKEHIRSDIVLLAD